MSNANKNKGKSWERDACKILEKYLGGNFMRVFSSGAFVGRTNSFRKETMSGSQILANRGDIIPPDEYPNFVAECKFYKDFNFHQLFTNECKQLDLWIDQTLDCVDEGNFWLLMIKINRRGTFVVFDKCHLEKFNMVAFAHYKDYVFTDLETFLEKNKETIKELSK